MGRGGGGGSHDRSMGIKIGMGIIDFVRMNGEPPGRSEEHDYRELHDIMGVSNFKYVSSKKMMYFFIVKDMRILKVSLIHDFKAH